MLPETKVLIRKMAVKYGVAGGIMAIIVFLVQYFLKLDPFTSIKIPDGLVLGIFIFFALREFREINKTLSMKQGILTGISCYLIIALLTSIFIYVMVTYIDPSLLAKYIDQRITFLMNQRATVEKIYDVNTFKTNLDNIKNTTSFILAWDDFLKKSFIGLILTIITTVVLRKSS